MTPNRERLFKLALTLASLPSDYEHFSMGVFYTDYNEGKRGADTLKIKCGTAACAIGHIPSIFPEEVTKLLKETDFRTSAWWWETVSESILGIDDESELWNFLFSGEWESHDNSPQGAANRIFFYLYWGDDWVENLDSTGPYDSFISVNYEDAPDYTPVSMEAVLSLRKKLKPIAKEFGYEC